MVELNLYSNIFHDHLTVARLEKGGYPVALEEWRNLDENHSTGESLGATYDKVSILASLNTSIWEDTISKFAGEFLPWIDDRCERGCTKSNWVQRIAVWRELWRRLVEMNPRGTVLQDQLSLGCKLHGNVDTAISVWESLIDKYPEEIWFYPRLNRLLEDKQNGTLEAVVSWKRLIDKYPNIPSLHGQLYQAFGTSGTEEVVVVWVKSSPDVLSMRKYLDGAIRAKRRRDALARVNLLESNIADSEHPVPLSIPVLPLVQPSGAFAHADVASRRDISPAVTLTDQITTKPMEEIF